MSTTPEEEELAINVEFLKGNLTLSSSDYFDQCMNALEWAFSKFLIREEVMSAILKAAFLDMYSYVVENFPKELKDYTAMREIFSLDIVPFRYTKKKQLNIHDLAKEDERKLVFEALLLFILRTKIPNKYSCEEDFLNEFPHARERSEVEQQRQFHTSNWMDLMFYTITARHNKALILNVITRIVEGRDARYITGSGQTKPTNDRVLIFSTIGNCEKIPRPPRKVRKERELANLEALKRQYEIFKNQVDKSNQPEKDHDDGKQSSKKKKSRKTEEEPEETIMGGSESQSLMSNSENIQRLKSIVDSIIVPGSTDNEEEIRVKFTKTKRGRKPKAVVVVADNNSNTDDVVVVPEESSHVIVDKSETDPISGAATDRSDNNKNNNSNKSDKELSGGKEEVVETKIVSSVLKDETSTNPEDNAEAAEPPVKRRRKKSLKAELSEGKTIEEVDTKKIVKVKGKETRGRKPKVNNNNNTEIPEVFDINNANYNLMNSFSYPYMFQNLPDYLSAPNNRDRSIDSPLQLPQMHPMQLLPYSFPAYPNFFYPNIYGLPDNNNFNNNNSSSSNNYNNNDNDDNINDDNQMLDEENMEDQCDKKNTSGDSELTSLKTSTTIDTTNNETSVYNNFNNNNNNNSNNNNNNPWYIDPNMQYMYPPMMPPPFLYPGFMFPPHLNAMPMVAGMPNMNSNNNNNNNNYNNNNYNNNNNSNYMNYNTASYGTLESDLTDKSYNNNNCNSNNNNNNTTNNSQVKNKGAKGVSSKSTSKKN